MSSLRSKSAQDISDLLDEYGIKHGPVVDSTRGLYERKLKEAMAKGKVSKASPDKTFYREEVAPTYGQDQIRVRGNLNLCKLSIYESLHWLSSDMYDTPSTYRDSYKKSTPMKSPEAPKSSRLIPLWVQFVFFLAVVLFLYLIFSSMEANESLKGIE
uniref:LEM domain-containing protein n=1 Tax=Gasterosteus aculeatus aculeatus TaxID=481459 RepID=G3NXG8_GASAC